MRSSLRKEISYIFISRNGENAIYLFIVNEERPFLPAIFVVIRNKRTVFKGVEETKDNKSEIVSQVDWDKCMPCQNVTTERLQCPLDSMQKEADAWYDTLCLNIWRSRDLGCMPFETRLLTLGLQKGELSQLFCAKRDKRHKW